VEEVVVKGGRGGGPLILSRKEAGAPTFTSETPAPPAAPPAAPAAPAAPPPPAPPAPLAATTTSEPSTGVAVERRNKPCLAPVAKTPVKGCSKPLGSNETVATAPTEWMYLARPGGKKSEMSSKLVLTDSVKIPGIVYTYIHKDIYYMIYYIYYIKYIQG